MNSLSWNPNIYRYQAQVWKGECKTSKKEKSTSEKEISEKCCSPYVRRNIKTKMWIIRTYLQKCRGKFNIKNQIYRILQLWFHICLSIKKIRKFKVYYTWPLILIVFKCCTAYEERPRENDVSRYLSILYYFSYR